MNNLLKRSLSGLIYVIVVIAGIMTSDITMLLLCMLLAIPAIREFYLMADSTETPTQQIAYPQGKWITWPLLWLEICGLTLIAGVWQCVQYQSCVILGCSIMALLVRMILSLYSHSGTSPLRALSTDISAIVYVALPLALLNYIYYQSHLLVLTLFIFIWLNDTGAFLFGSMFGRRRLFPSISPKKSWEGFFGGLAVVIIASVLLKIYCNGLHFIALPAFVVYAVLVSVFATWGDLLESYIKRTANVKDSGRLMPGHGGALDRIDSLLAVSLATTAFLMII